jgi:hypothetical protein
MKKTCGSLPLSGLLEHGPVTSTDATSLCRSSGTVTVKVLAGHEWLQSSLALHEAKQVHAHKDAKISLDSIKAAKLRIERSLAQRIAG